MRLHLPNDHAVVQMLAAIGAYCAILAQADKPLTEPHLQAAAIAGACTAVLALKKRPGQ